MCALARVAGVPLSMCLDEWNAIAAVGVAHPNKYGLTLTGDEDVFFSMSGDACPREDGYCLVI